MAIDDVYVMTTTAQGPGGYYQNNFAVSLISATEPTEANFATLATDFRNIVLSAQDANITWRTWKARQVRGAGVTWPTGADCNPVGGKLFEANYGAGSTGTYTGDLLPAQCAMVVTLKTGIAGRRYRGRIYHFGLCMQQQNDGVWNSAAVTPVTTGWATFSGKYVPGSAGNLFQLSVWSHRTASGCEPDPVTKRHTRVDPPHPELACTPVNSTLLRTIVYTQRRRVAGVGR